MKFSKLTLAIATTLGASVSFSAFAIDLYVDTKTKQIYAEPGPGRVLMGNFEKVGDTPAKAAAPASEAAEIKSIKEDLELKQNEIKALEESVVATREEKAKNDEKWFNKINMRGYTQMRYNHTFAGDRNFEGGVRPELRQPELRSPGDSSIKDNSNFSFRRVRLVFSGDINDYVSLYLQPDFASTDSGGGQNFVQIRDAYADIAFTKNHEYRIRPGQSKVPFGWENLQSSQNRVALDRDDALNSAVPSERDLGIFAYYTPEHVQKLWKDLSKKGLKTSGDYGVLGFGVYNGQGINKLELNDNLFMVAHTTYPLDLKFLGYPFTGQVVELGVDAITGDFVPTTAAGYQTFNRPVTVAAPTPANPNGLQEQRVAVHAILFPQPFGLQTEWNWGNGGGLDQPTNKIVEKSINGGYVQAMYKIDNIFKTQGTLIPYARWQTYRGPYKGATNSPVVNVSEYEVGAEWQIMKALELTLAYAYMDRTNTYSGSSFLGQAHGDVFRSQLQWNY